MSDVLPHRYPFRWIDDRPDPDGHRSVRLTSGLGTLRGAVECPPIFAIEILAQAAAFQLLPRTDAPEEGQAGTVYLAAIRHAELPRILGSAGDRLEAHVEVRRTFGRMADIHGELWRDDTCVARVELMVVRDGEPLEEG